MIGLLVLLAAGGVFVAVMSWDERALRRDRAELARLRRAAQRAAAGRVEGGAR